MPGMTRIDDSHTPFKRKKSIGPGPKRQPPVKQTKHFVCERPRHGRKKGFYTQDCVDTKTGIVHVIRRKKSKKKAYNKVYRTWTAKRKAPKSRPLPSYRCRRTRVASCR